MTWTADPIDKDVVSGLPQYTAQQLRQARSMLWTPAGPTRPLGARTGVRPGSNTFNVDVSAWPTITVGPGAAVMDVQTPVATGAYEVSSDANDSTLTGTAAHATLDRIDGVFVELFDHNVDTLGQRKAALKYVAGTAGGGAPATPPRCLMIAAINVPHSGGPAPSATMINFWTVALGGIVPTAGSSAPTSFRPTPGYAGLYIDDPDHGLMRCDGAGNYGTPLLDRRKGTATGTIGAGASSVSGTVTFSTPLPAAPSVVLTTPTFTAGIPRLVVQVSAKSATGFDFAMFTATGATIGAAQACPFYYLAE